MVQIGYDPIPPVFQTGASTKLASAPSVRTLPTPYYRFAGGFGWLVRCSLTLEGITGFEPV